MLNDALIKREVLGSQHIPYVRHVDAHTVALANGDRCGVALFDSEVLGYLPPRSHSSSFGAIVDAVYNAQSRWQETPASRSHISRWEGVRSISWRPSVAPSRGRNVVRRRWRSRRPSTRMGADASSIAPNP